MTFHRKLIFLLLFSICAPIVAKSNQLQHNEGFEKRVKVSPATDSTQIRFTIDFESGSLDSVALFEKRVTIQADSSKMEWYSFDIYSRLDPINPVDTALPPSGRWFHFKMDGVKDKMIGLQFHRTDPKRPFYSYDGKNYTRFTPEDIADKRFIQKKFTEESVWIAYFVPYTGSYLKERIAEWSKKGCVRVESIGKSEMGREMPLLIVTNPSKERKKAVYIQGRIHTSEAPASWHLDKMIDILVSEDEYAKALRDKIVFYIVPFTNPDGVAEGMSRSNAKGVNLEINWARPEDQTMQEVKNMKGLFAKILAEHKEIAMALNMHSQSSDFCTYWIHKAESTSESFYKNQMLLANLTIDNNKYFKKSDLSFSNVAPRYVEGWFWERFAEKTLATCYETPYTYYNRNADGEWVTLENLREMAYNNIYAMGYYFGISSRERVIITTPSKLKGCRKMDDFNHIYLGDKYYRSKKADARATYNIKGVDTGVYKVYKWQTGENLTTSKTGENEWIEIGRIEQKKSNKRYKYTIEAERKGDNFNALLLIKER